MIFGYPFESCKLGLDCERGRVIMRLKIHNNFLIPIWEMQVGSWALVTLRDSFAHFDRIRIVLGLIMVDFEWI
jgi:hypothetical protein